MEVTVSTVAARVKNLRIVITPVSTHHQISRCLIEYCRSIIPKAIISLAFIMVDSVEIVDV